MAKLTAIQTLNAVLRNIGEAQVASITALTGIQLVAWDKITEAMQDLVTDQNTRWSFLESLGQVTLSTGNNAYTITGLTSGSDMMIEDKESVRSSDSGRRIPYKTPQEWDAMYPKGITTDATGYPDFYTKYANQFVFNKQASSVQNTKNIDFRYWKLPTYFATATSTGTTEIPEPFDRTLLVALATLKTMTYLGNPEASVYKVQVFGNDRDIEGSLDKMKRLFTSPLLKPRMTYRF